MSLGELATMKDMLNQEIDAKTFEALCSAGVIREVTICRVFTPTKEERWAIQVQYGRNTQWLRSKREPQRLFNTPNTALRLVYNSGISHMQVDFG
jgi:hypothetical protein